VTEAAAGDRTRQRVFIVAVLALAMLTFDVFLAVRHGFFDLDVYHGAINYWVHDGGSLYDYLKPFSTYGFTYPPFAALVMLPMAITSWHVAIVISCITCVAATVVLIYWLVDPVARREGWVRWYAMALVLCFAIPFEPLRETFLFGQVNMYLVLLVAADLLLLVSRRHRFGGVLIGLATAIKLTPGVFIVYLAVTRRWRAALVASGTAAVATIFAAAVAPDASRVFWTDAFWNTDRIGAVAFISNQSLHGAVARLNPGDPSTVLWIASVLVIVAVWAVRVRRAVAAGDEMTGFALTGIVGCLVSPITWVHHLVWFGPALLLLLDNALRATDRRQRKRLLTLMIISYVLLCSRIVWSFHERWDNPLGWLLSNTYVWIGIVLLCVLPVRQAIEAPTGSASADGATATPDDGTPDETPQREFDREVAGLIEDQRAPVPGDPEPGPRRLD
jgi:alpha-1,2-mannosyltransferase